MPRGLPARLFPAAVFVSGVLLVAAWGISNPASIVATTNLGRADHGHRFDVYQAASLGPDAVPTLTAGLGQLDAPARRELRNAICVRSPGKHAGTAFNLATARAAKATTKICH